MISLGLRISVLFKQKNGNFMEIITRELRFYRDDDGRWYVHLPEWEGDAAELEMVAGADVLLEKISRKRDQVTIKVSNDSKLGEDGWEKLELVERKEDIEEGAM